MMTLGLYPRLSSLSDTCSKNAGSFLSDGPQMAAISIVWFEAVSMLSIIMFSSLASKCPRVTPVLFLQALLVEQHLTVCRFSVCVCVCPSVCER